MRHFKDKNRFFCTSWNGFTSFRTCSTNSVASGTSSSSVSTFGKRQKNLMGSIKEKIRNYEQNIQKREQENRKQKNFKQRR